MEHVLLKATTTTVVADLGEFEAVISTEAVDREKDIVVAAGMVAALHKWNRPIPLSWNHGLKAEDIFGEVDPQSARDVGGEVVINGKVDLKSNMGTEAWRSFKSRTVGFSFGYLIPDGGATKRKGGGRHITQLDVFEITATPAPMNNETRVLATKAMPPADLLAGMIDMAKEYIANPPDAEDADEMRGILDDLNELVADVDDAADQAEDEGKSLRALLREMRKQGLQEPTWIIPDELEAVAVNVRRMLDPTKSVDVNDQDGTTVVSLDPLRAKADALALEFASDGESLIKAAPKPPAPPAAGMTLEDMRAVEYGLTLATLSEETS